MRSALLVLALTSLSGGCSVEGPSVEGPSGGSDDPSARAPIDPQPEPAPSISPQPQPNPWRLPTLLPEKVSVLATAGGIELVGDAGSLVAGNGLRVLDLDRTEGLRTFAVEADGSFRASFEGTASDRLLLDAFNGGGQGAADHGLPLFVDGDGTGRLRRTAECLATHILSPVPVNAGTLSAAVLVENRCARAVVLSLVAIGGSAEAPPTSIPSGAKQNIRVTFPGPLSTPVAAILQDEAGKGRLAVIFEGMTESTSE